MDRKVFVDPACEILRMDVSDVITTSTGMGGWGGGVMPILDIPDID